MLLYLLVFLWICETEARQQEAYIHVSQMMMMVMMIMMMMMMTMMMKYSLLDRNFIKLVLVEIKTNV